jgi:hypothetical protein
MILIETSKLKLDKYFIVSMYDYSYYLFIFLLQTLYKLINLKESNFKMPKT